MSNVSIRKSGSGLMPWTVTCSEHPSGNFIAFDFEDAVKMAVRHIESWTKLCMFERLRNERV